MGFNFQKEIEKIGINTINKIGNKISTSISRGVSKTASKTIKHITKRKKK